MLGRGGKCLTNKKYFSVLLPFPNRDDLLTIPRCCGIYIEVDEYGAFPYQLEKVYEIPRFLLLPWCCGIEVVEYGSEPGLQARRGQGLHQPKQPVAVFL